VTTVRPYDPVRDEAAALDLWRECMGDRWPITPECFRLIVAGEGFAVVAAAAGHVLGLASGQVDGTRGSVTAVLVTPGHRRRGLGRALLAGVLGEVARRGAVEARLGGGGASFFWCGVPDDTPGAWPFFAACGWERQETAYDLVGDLGACSTPAWVWERAAAAGAEVRRAAPADLEPSLRFLQSRFPQWAAHYTAMAAAGEGNDIVVAASANGEVLGVSSILSPRSAQWRRRFPWPGRLRSRTGGVGALGVAEEQRGRGIGLALAAFVTQELRAEGLDRSYAGWTWLIDWYGHLGYRFWQAYAMSRRAL